MIEYRFVDCVDIVGRAPSQFDGEKIYVSTGALQTDHIDYDQTEIITYESRPSRANLSAEIGDVLFAKMQATSKTLVIDATTHNHIFSTGFCAVRAKKEMLNNRCLYHIVSGEDFLRSKDQNCSGATQKAITNAGLAKIRISLPPIDEQESIALRLDTIDKAISQCRSILEVLDATIKSRFIEMFGDPDSNPKGWEKGPMGDYMTLLTDFSANGSYAYLDSNVTMYDQPNYALMIRTTDLERGDFEKDVKYIDEKAYNILAKSKIYGGEIIMNKIGSAGKVYLMPHLNKPVSLGRNAFMFRFDERIDTSFLFYLLRTEYGTREIMQHVRGAVTKTITKDAVRSVRIIVPSIDHQKQFVDFVATIEGSKKAVNDTMGKAEELKASLMQEYFG